MKLFIKILVVIYCATNSGGCDLIPIWDYLGKGEVEQQKFYLDEIRFMNLKEVNLLKGDPDVTLSQAARAAYAARENKVRGSRIESISLLSRLIKKKRIYYYEVRFEDEDSDFLETVFIAIDGEAIPKMSLVEWEKLKRK